jgi:hypothetical protein
MASIFPFRTRRRERDEETDEARFTRLASVVAQIAAEIETERTGLETRYRSETADAGFLLEALANDDASVRSSVRAEHLTSSILRCEQRLATLAGHAGLMTELQLLLQSHGCRGSAEGGRSGRS